MTDRSGAAPRADRGEGRERPDALAYWYLQEATPLDTDGIAGLPEAEPEELFRRRVVGERFEVFQEACCGICVGVFHI